MLCFLKDVCDERYCCYKLLGSRPEPVISVKGECLESQDPGWRRWRARASPTRRGPPRPGLAATQAARAVSRKLRPGWVAEKLLELIDCGREESSSLSVVMGTLKSIVKTVAETC
jgi:hypothetical protein